MATPQPKGTILVTGAGGYVGGQIVREALESGFNVRITARTESSATRTISNYPSFASALSYTLVPDMTILESYAPAFADGAIEGIIHSASPVNFSPQDNVRDLLDPAIKGATTILEAARRFGRGKVRRVVVTSSFAAVVDPEKGVRPGYTYDEKDWNPVTWEGAVTAQKLTAYMASKTLAERAMWRWMDEHGDDVAFTLATICPPWVFGPYVRAPATRAALSESVLLLDDIVDGAAVPPFDYGGYADSREVAAAHVRALEAPDGVAGGQRFLVGQNFRYQAAVDGAREALPEARARLPVGKPGDRSPEDAHRFDGSKAARVLGVEYGTLKDTAVETYKQLFEIRKLEREEEEAKAKA
ncbi:NAD(P)-binding protein [Daldinia caldariorum]|uniref:NAD(P)-binding protein n=1 Tax=Daldinia caldariorum TaxID=326644 RepID=UPI00200851A1|nr:NAD(P)-binding protein [Daldinia caldariorum]KAI1472673.1 NAD(P)-binding protein [Daldinia caldariorum]